MLLEVYVSAEESSMLFRRQEAAFLIAALVSNTCTASPTPAVDDRHEGGPDMKGNTTRCYKTTTTTDIVPKKKKKGVGPSCHSTTGSHQTKAKG